MRYLTLAALSAACFSFVAACAPPVPTYLPVSAEELGTPVDPDIGYRIENFGEGAYMLTDGVYQSLFFVTEDSVIAVDAPPTIGNNILRGIRNVTDLPITHLVYSHAHADHISAAYLLVGPNTTIVAHKEVVTGLAPAVNDNRPLPTFTFEKDYNLTVGNQTLELSYKGNNHCAGNIFIYSASSKVLMLVDVLTPGWIPYHGLGASQDIPGFIKAHDLVLEYDFEYFIGGHINRYGTREDAELLREYVYDVYNNCVEATNLAALPPNATNPISESVLLPPMLAANPNNGWAISAYLDGARVDYCVNKTNTKWNGKLAALDVFSDANALIMMETIKIDFGNLGSDGIAP